MFIGKVTFLALIFLSTSLEFIFGLEVYSNCYKSTNWTKNDGDAIRSWIGSIVPSASKFKKDIDIQYSQNGSPFKIYSPTSQIRWETVGSHAIDGWKYGKTNKEGKFVKRRTYFIFPDFKTAFVGIFDKSILISGRETRVTHFRCIKGTMELRFSKPKVKSPIYRHVQRNEKIYSDNHLLRDPLDRKNVYIGSSSSIPEIAHQDALFARRDIPAFSLVAYYGGGIIPINDYLNFPNMTADELEDFTKNQMRYNDTHSIDIQPPKSDIRKYRSTLGHKANHRFMGINTFFNPTFHPVYGRIVCLRSIRYIHRGEEIFVNYGYNMQSKTVPKWYRDLHNKVYKQKQCH